MPDAGKDLFRQMITLLLLSHFGMMAAAAEEVGTFDGFTFCNDDDDILAFFNY